MEFIPLSSWSFWVWLNFDSRILFWQNLTFVLSSLLQILGSKKLIVSFRKLMFETWNSILGFWNLYKCHDFLEQHIKFNYILDILGLNSSQIFFLIKRILINLIWININIMDIEETHFNFDMLVHSGKEQDSYWEQKLRKDVIVERWMR